MLKIGVTPLPAGCRELPGMPGWLSRVLWARGITDAQAAARFLSPGMDQLLPPEMLHDMPRAIALLTAARDKGQRAVIYGDYDVDGVCASAILKEAFSEFRLEADVYLPDRHREGYGLNADAVRTLARDHQLLITVDCGITALAEAALARELGMTVIVTDHHRHLDQLPPADAVITPLLADYPFPYLCGAGVAWKLAWALLRGGAMELMDLAALATVADMVPLTGENRALTALGLQRLSAAARPGLRAVMNRAGLLGRITSDQVAFQLAPRMNACGRMESAGIALEMLLTRDEARAEELALKMEGLNQERRRQEALVLDQAQAQVEAMDLVDVRAIVVTGEGWNSGVVGLAAGRIAEKYGYPAVALAREGDVCVGSARSAGDIDIHAALCQCADLFDRFGGHKQAAGLTLRADRVDEFTSRLSRAVAEQTGGRPPIPEMMCDGEMTLHDVTEEAVQWLNRLEPFGVGNPAPRFLCQGVDALSLVPVGAQGRHLKCAFRQGNDLRDGIFFGAGELRDLAAGKCRMVMTPVLNDFRGKVTAECRLYALMPQPETLEKDPGRESVSYLSEALGDESAPEVTPSRLDALMKGGQGTLLVCRCLETAREMQRRYPHADFCVGRADDPRAYHTVLLYGTAGRVSPAYRQVVLCDGNLGEAGGYAAACPRASIHARPVSGPARNMLSGLYVPVEELRRCYVSLRAALPRDAQAWAAQCGLSLEKGMFALRVLAEIDLIELCPAPFRVAMRPMTRRSPEESALYRRARLAKEGN